MKSEDAPFYLAVNNVKTGSGKPWFKKAPVGVKKLNTFMKTVAKKTGLGPNFKNHSGRKIMIQTLVNNDVPPTDIMQLSGHKNVQSITSYDRLTETTVEHVSHSHWTEFGRNSSPVLLFYSGEKKARVWRTHLPNISSNFFSAKQASTKAASFSFFRVLL